MTWLNSVCLYCGSSDAAESHRQAARRFGELMGCSGLRLVFGGGGIGLMKLAAEAARDNGGKVTGIIPDFLIGVELAPGPGTELVLVETMHERKARMAELSDAFVILPGGFGTLDEMIEILTWKQLGLHGKPIILINVDKYWQPLLELVDHMLAAGYVRPAHRALLTVVDSVDAVFSTLAAMPPPSPKTAVERG